MFWATKDFGGSSNELVDKWLESTSDLDEIDFVVSEIVSLLSAQISTLESVSTFEQVLLSYFSDILLNSADSSHVVNGKTSSDSGSSSIGSFSEFRFASVFVPEALFVSTFSSLLLSLDVTTGLDDVVNEALEVDDEKEPFPLKLE